MTRAERPSGAAAAGPRAPQRKRMSQKPLIAIEVIGVAILAVLLFHHSDSAHRASAPTAGPVSTQPAATTTSAATTTTEPPTTTTTINPRAKARDDYLKIATAAYQVHLVARTRFTGRSGYIAWRDFPAYCAAVDGSDDIFAHRLQVHWWPPSTRASIAALVRDTAALAALEHQCEQTRGTSRALRALTNQMHVSETTTTNDQTAVRSALNLPVTP